MRHILIATIASLALLACTHSPEEKRKRDFESSAQDRIGNMESNIKSLEARNSQLLGTPKQELGAAITALRTQTDEAKSELKELSARDANTWLQKKNTLDQELFEMDTAYNSALEVLMSH